MPDWQERMTRETAPALRAEEDLRYRFAGPLVLGARTWADLGCGTGAAAAEVVGGMFTGRAVLVDADEAVLEPAAAAIAAADTLTLAADLADRDALARVRAALLDGPAPRTVTCFEVIEQLETFVPLVELLSDLAEAGEATVLLSVPNDELWALGRGRTTWGEGSFAELRSLLPGTAVVARQLPLQGSAVVPEGRDGEKVTVALAPRGEGAVPTHFLAAMGPQAGALGVHAAVAQTDLDAQRAWERQREVDTAYLEAECKRLREELERCRREHDRVE